MTLQLGGRRASRCGNSTLPPAPRHLACPAVLPAVYLLDDGRDIEKKKFMHGLGLANAVYVRWAGGCWSGLCLPPLWAVPTSPLFTWLAGCLPACLHHYGLLEPAGLPAPPPCAPARPAAAASAPRAR